MSINDRALVSCIGLGGLFLLGGLVSVSDIPGLPRSRNQSRLTIGEGLSGESQSEARCNQNCFEPELELDNSQEIYLNTVIWPTVTYP